jgi:hypothetical protein
LDTPENVALRALRGTSSSVIRPELWRSISLGPGALPTRPENAVLTESAEPLFTCDLGRSGEELMA